MSEEITTTGMAVQLIEFKSMSWLQKKLDMSYSALKNRLEDGQWRPGDSMLINDLYIKVVELL